MQSAHTEPSLLRAAIFDVEGVIAFPDQEALASGLAEIDPSLTLERLHGIRHSPDLYPMWQAYSTGDMDGNAYWNEVLRAAGRPGTATEVAAIRGLQSRATWARLDEEVLLIADALRKAGLRVALLSNSADDYEPQISRFIHRFDCAHFSHRTGRRKPDPAAYLSLAAELAVVPEAILFIDDKPRNIDAAAAVGMRTCWFRSAGQLRLALADLGTLAP
jgi:putative hydrolase of the HAD superfamily